VYVGEGRTECLLGRNPCYYEMPDAGPPRERDFGPSTPDAGPAPLSLGFDPSNLGSWATARVSNDPPDLRVTGRIVRFNTDDGSASPGEPVEFAFYLQGGAPAPADRIAVWFFRSVTLNDATVVIEGSRPAAIVAMDSISIVSSRISASAGGWRGAKRRAGAAWGDGPGGGGFTRESTSVGAGAGGAYCSVGGLPSGGDESMRGSIYGAATIEPLLGGSGGGTNGIATAGDGGDGGGAIQLIAGSRLELDGASTIDVRGQPDIDTLATLGAGGGSGGSVLLEAPEIAIDGAVLAGGGNGGAVPGAGATGVTEAEDGGFESALNPKHGGGGGGFGRIRMNTGSSAPEIAVDALVSPGAGHRCTSYGSLSPPTEPPPPPPECSAASIPVGECGSCASEHCCDVLSECSDDTLCTTCLTSATPGPACAENALVEAVEACFVDLCPTTCESG